ncbi:hypothetical protein SMD10_01585 [Consotaella sp. CSK11QG-6]
MSVFSHLQQAHRHPPGHGFEIAVDLQSTPAVKSSAFRSSSQRQRQFDDRAIIAVPTGNQDHFAQMLRHPQATGSGKSNHPIVTTSRPRI